MQRTKKFTILFVILSCTVSMQFFSKSFTQYSTDYSVLKRAYQNKNNQILYELKPNIETIEPIEYPVTLRDKFSPRTRLDAVLDLPDYYTKGRDRYFGFPSQNEYEDVKSLEWRYTLPVREIWSQISMVNRYNVGNCIRTDLLEAFDSTPSYKYSCNIEEHNPIIQSVKGERVVLFPTLEKIVCLSALSGAKKWDYSLSSNDKIIPGMSSFQYHQNVYLVAATLQKKILVLDIENGKLVTTLYVNHKITSPLASFSYQEKPCIAFFTDSQVVILEVFSKAKLLEEESHSESYLSPLCIQANQTRTIVFPSQDGSIKGYCLQQKTWWNVQLTGRILYQVSYNAWDGVPYIVVSTTEKKIILIHGGSGTIIASKELPGIPVSPSMFIPKFNQFFVTVYLQKSSDMRFISGIFFSEEKPKQVSIPGENLLGFSSYAQNGISRFIFLNNRRELYSLCSDDKTLQKGYPLQLSRSQVSPGAIPKCICFSLTHGMLWVVLPGEGVFRFGNPSEVVVNASLSMQSKWSTGLINTARNYHTGTGYFNCVDCMPKLESPSFVKKEIVLQEENRPLPVPLSFWDTYQKKWFFVYIDNDGFIKVRDDKLQILFTVEHEVGKSQVPPIIEVDKNGGWHIYTVTSDKTTALFYEPSSKRIEVIWEATDMKSTGSSFQCFKYKHFAFLIFVSDTGYLVALEQKTGVLVHKEKVDAYTFATYYYKDTPALFCGSFMLNALTGKKIHNNGCVGSDSTIASLDGRTIWLQSFEDDMICKDVQSGNTLWKVRKLWCKKYCYRSTSPAVYKKGNIAFSYWSDYKRIVCVDMRSGLIRWRKNIPNDYVLEQPIVVDTNENAYVVFTTINGHIYKVNAWSGELLDHFYFSEEKTPGIYAGLSTPVFLNNCLLFSRASYGYYRIGFPKATSIGIPSRQFQTYISSLQRGKHIFNRAELYWNDYTTYSNIIKTLMQ